MRGTGTRWLVTTAATAALLLAPAAAHAGGWFGIHVGSDGFGFSMGFSTWEPYTDAWYDPDWSIDFDVALSPYGEWVWVDGLGRVWRPWVAASWRPYTWGRWLWTDFGWTWVSYEPWGYIPHHFGHWALAPVGWVWVPGYTWRPAAVSWYTWGGYVGWCPTPPPGWRHAWAYRHGFSDGYRVGYRDGWADARFATWVDWNGLAADNVAGRAYRWSEIERRVPRGRITPLGSGPRRSVVEARLGRPLPTARVDRREVRVNGHRVTVARPVGVTRDIERHARSVTERTLRPEVAHRIESRLRQRTVSSSVSRRSGTGSVAPRPEVRRPATSTRPEPTRSSGRRYDMDAGRSTRRETASPFRSRTRARTENQRRSTAVTPPRTRERVTVRRSVTVRSPRRPGQTVNLPSRERTTVTRSRTVRRSRTTTVRPSTVTRSRTVGRERRAPGAQRKVTRHVSRSQRIRPHHR